MSSSRAWDLVIATAAASLLSVATGCDKTSDGGATSSAGAKSAAAKTSTPKEKDPADYVPELAKPATREAATKALIDYDWDQVSGGFPLTVKMPLEELLTKSADDDTVKAAIKVCDKLGPMQSYPCEEGLKLLIKKLAVTAESDGEKANRDRACHALSPGGSADFEKLCP